jgi:uncharacterized protein (TIGR02466 family)
MEYMNLFQIPVQKNELELNIASLISFCYEMERKNKEGVKLTNVGGWQSDDVINETHTEFVELKNKIEEAANTYHKDIQLKNNLKEKISNIWININEKGHLNELHHHPHSILSGAFYLRGKAPIIFQHPFPHINTYFWDQSIIEEWNGVTSGSWVMEPKPNMLLLFPAWLNHKVHYNKEDTDRISISFNTTLQDFN